MRFTYCHNIYKSVAVRADYDYFCSEGMLPVLFIIFSDYDKS